MTTIYIILTFLLGFIIPIIFYIVVLRPINKENEIDYKKYINLKNEIQELKHKNYILKKEIKKYNKERNKEK